MFWFRKAAEQGSNEAEYALGEIYETGRGTAIDNNNAMDWYGLAADKGNALAQFKLGTFYLLGKGTNPNPVLAYQWFSLASKRGVLEASLKLRDLARELRPAQIDEAEDRAERWENRHRK